MNAHHELTDHIRAARPAAATLTIYRIPPNVKTLIAVKPEAIESFPGVSVEEVTDAATIDAAIDALAASAPEPSDRPIDVRHALIFTDAGGERVLRAYKGRFASHGQIDATPCAYGGTALHEWIASRGA